MACLMGSSGVSHFASDTLGTLLLFDFARVYVSFVLSQLFSVVCHQPENSRFDLLFS